MKSAKRSELLNIRLGLQNTDSIELEFVTVYRSSTAFFLSVKEDVIQNIQAVSIKISINELMNTRVHAIFSAASHHSCRMFEATELFVIQTNSALVV